MSVTSAPVEAATRRVTVARVVQAACLLDERRLRLEDLRGLVAHMLPSQLVPLSAESNLVARLAVLVTEARTALHALSEDEADDHGRALDAVEAALGSVDWAVAERTLVDLREREQELQTYIKDLRVDRDTYRGPFRQFYLTAEAAEKTWQITLSDDEKALADIEGKFAYTDDQYAAEHYDGVAAVVERAKKVLRDQGLSGVADLDQRRQVLLTRIQERQDRANRLGRRAELFVISGKPEGTELPYTVLLRRPRYQGRQETNLYDDVNVLEMDQVLFRDTIEVLTADAISNIRSSGLAPTVRHTRPAGSQVPQHLRDLTPDKRLEMVGRRMYGLLIPDAMQRLLDETPDVPLTITSNKGELPWELMHDGKEFLCLKRMFARMPTGQTFPRRTRDDAPASDRARRVLLISSGRDTDLPQAVEEVRELEKIFTDMEAKVVTITGDEVTSARLTDELCLGGHDIVHYAGHAGFDPEHPEHSHLLLPNGEHFRAERVQRLLEGHPIVFLNACESSRSGEEPTDGSTASTLAQSQGLANAFVYGGAQACVGSLWPVFDDTARAFAREFYRQLISRSEPVGEALRLARIICKAQQQDRSTWAAYALYGDPAYRVGQVPTTTWVAPS